MRSPQELLQHILQVQRLRFMQKVTVAWWWLWQLQPG